MFSSASLSLTRGVSSCLTDFFLLGLLWGACCTCVRCGLGSLDSLLLAPFLACREYCSSDLCVLSVKRPYFAAVCCSPLWCL